MSFYSEMAATAQSLITEFGQSITITYLTVGAYDPATSTSVVTETTATAKGAIFDYGTQDIDGTLIRTGDKQLYVGVVGLTIPSIGDKITIGTTTYIILMSKLLSPAGTNVLLECQLRGAS